MKRILDDKEIDVIPAESIRAEKEHIRGLKCLTCGGSYTLKQQALFAEDLLDLLVVECNGCKQNEEIYFDISSFFGKEE
jgi:hypothetical protein